MGGATTRAEHAANGRVEIVRTLLKAQLTRDQYIALSAVCAGAGVKGDQVRSAMQSAHVTRGSLQHVGLPPTLAQPSVYTRTPRSRTWAP